MTVHWKYLDITVQWQRGIHMVDVRIGGQWWYVRYQLNVPVDAPTVHPIFVRKSTFTTRVIVHPSPGPPYGNAVRFVCDQCGADYPYGANPSPCAFCAVSKQSGIHVQLGRKCWNW